MRIARAHTRLVASILVIGLLAVALTFVCSDGIHFAGAMDRGCATMAHTDGISATIGSESSQTLLPGLLVAVLTLALFMFRLDAPLQLVQAGASPGLPPDPLHGRLRL